MQKGESMHYREHPLSPELEVSHNNMSDCKPLNIIHVKWKSANNIYTSPGTQIYLNIFVSHNKIALTV